MCVCLRPDCLPACLSGGPAPALPGPAFACLPCEDEHVSESGRQAALSRWTRAKAPVCRPRALAPGVETRVITLMFALIPGMIVLGCINWLVTRIRDARNDRRQKR